MKEKEPTSEKLSRAMQEHNCPNWMIQRAKEGYYDDYKSPIATPCFQLVQDLSKIGAHTLAHRAKNGEFDAQKWEGDEWINSPEGKEAMESFPEPIRKEFFGPFNEPPKEGEK